MDQELLIRQVKKWQADLEEFLEQAAKAKNSRVIKILEGHKTALESLERALSGSAGPKQADFWPEETRSGSVEQIVEGVVQRISRLKLPKISD